MKQPAITRSLLQWYEVHRRNLPWRGSADPYRIWISEIMAQQTQLERVVTYYQRWLKRFPDVTALAAADEDVVLKLWEGLGYYSRARHILAAARKIMSRFGGEFPRQFAEIRSLPGIGDYTAGAIASMAFGLPVPAVDANVLRVFARLDNLDQPIRNAATRAAVTRRVRSLQPAERPGDFNEALMELGALVCTRNPACDLCPLQVHCEGFRTNVVADRPVKEPKPGASKISMVSGVLPYGGKLLIQKRRLDNVWPGLWEFPGGVIEKGESPETALVREFQEELELAVEPETKIAVVRYSYTRYRVTMHAYYCRLAGDAVPLPVFKEALTGRFVSPGVLGDYAFPAGHRKLIDIMVDKAEFSRRLAQS
ncbi:MAG: A/G-specific adenine glycosylase [bacterium]